MKRAAAVLSSLMVLSMTRPAAAQEPAIPKSAVAAAQAALVAKHGEKERGRIERGVAQVAADVAGGRR